MRIALAFVVAVVLAGCSSTVRVVSEPVGATVQAEGRGERLTTPCEVDVGGLGNLNDTGGVHLKFTRAGYVTTDAMLIRSVPGWTVGVLPFIPIPYPRRTLCYPEELAVTLKPEPVATK